MTAHSDWRLYRGATEPHDGIETLPPPPPWRAFDGPVLDHFVPDPAAGNGSEDRTAAAAARYLPEENVVEMANIAIRLRRPLLVTGKPGTGKSSLARSIAYELRLGRLLYWPITSRSRLQDALYRYDSLARLQQANIAKLQNGADPVPSIGEFIHLGPLGTAFVGRDRPRVLLIDELDKSDIDLPNDLLNILEEGHFDLAELTRNSDFGDVRVRTAEPEGWATIRHGVVRCHAYPIIVITSNGEREFPPAFLRRCVRVRIQPPSAEKLARIVADRLGQDALTDAAEVMEQFASLRETTDVSTDQLLNAVYFATSGTQPDPEVRKDIIRRLLRGLGPAGGA